MTIPDISPYPDEYNRLTTASERLSREFEFTHFSETNKRVFEMAAHNEFGEAGFTIEIDWKEIYKNGTPTGVWLPGIEITGRNKVEEETDHDRVKWGVVKGLVDGQSGYIREDGSRHEEPRKKDIL
jgi:hypothetical protein